MSPLKQISALALVIPLLVVAGCSDSASDSNDNGNSNDNSNFNSNSDNPDGGLDPDASTGVDAAVGADAAVGPDAAVGAPLLDRLSVTDVTAPEGVKAGVSNWRIWGTSSLGVAPVFTVPLANCETLVGYTTGSGGSLTARAVHLDMADQVVGTVTLGTGFELRGLAAEPDGHFAALLWDNGADQIFVQRFDLSGTAGWNTELTNATNVPDDFTIGDSRLEYGDSKYGAYYHVHSDSGHEGDTLKWVSASAGVESTAWPWGCSHSMSALLRFNPTLGTPRFLPVCVTDCYPGTSGSNFSTDSIGGIYLNHSASKVMDVCAGCNGSVAGEIGGAALSPGGWKLVFNAHQNAATTGQSSYNTSTMNQDIGFSSVGANLSSTAVVWLTDTPGIEETDSSIARWQPDGDPTEQYVVGWAEPGGGSYIYKLARVDPAGAFLEAGVDISAVAQWGRRDDPFRGHVTGDIVWAWFDSPGSTTLHFARLVSGGPNSCTSFAN
jgi:hypothetical protein